MDRSEQLYAYIAAVDLCLSGSALIANQSANCARIIDSKSPMRDRQTDRQTCKIEDTDSELDLNSEFKAAQCQQTFVVSAQQVLFAESREKIIHNKLLYGVCSI